MKLSLSHNQFCLRRVDRHWRFARLNDCSGGAQVVKIHDQHPLDAQLPDKGFDAGVQRNRFFSWVDLPGTYANT